MAQTRRSRHCHAGFTLLELLVVVAIMAVLAAVLLPALSQARAQARRTLCATHIRAFGNALTLYHSDLGRYPDWGDRAPRSVFGSTYKTGDPKPSRAGALDNIGDVAEALVVTGLGDPRMLYCPVSSWYDQYAPGPYLPVPFGGQLVPNWRSGQISYMYLVGIDHTYPAAGVPTYLPEMESPDRRLRKYRGTAILAGDRTVELPKGLTKLAGSNHRKEGGWFYYTDGHAQWWPWERLTPHPTPKYIWYWPRMARY